MNRRSLLGTGAAASQGQEWDPKTKEAWFIEFEKEPVNDDKWSCIVTAAIQNEAQDEECIQTYTQCVNTGLRRAVKIISMADVIKLLKGNNGGSNTRSERLTRRTPLKASSTRLPQVLNLVTRYATFTGSECRLHPDLMAIVLKYMILNMKQESCLRKKIDIVRERKIREQKIKEKFIRDLKPFEGGNEEKKYQRKVSLNILELEDPINDEPVGGPDLYIMLTDFLNVCYYPQLQMINIPFVAILKISTRTEPGMPFVTTEHDPEGRGRRRSSVSAFWEKLNEECFTLAKASKFKDIAVIEYEAPLKSENPTQNYRILFDELTWLQYSVYSICRQHQKYLKQLHVQKLVLSLEPLDLSKCEVYNKLSDALITGEPLTPLLVLYAIVEQVVAGVPKTESIAVEYQQKPTDFFNTSSFLEFSEKSSQQTLVTPCKECRGKKYESFCDKIKQLMDTPSQEESEEEWTENSDENSTLGENSSKSEQNGETSLSTTKTLESLITKILKEKKTEKEIREDKKWKTPSLCFYGDSVRLQTTSCDPRLLDSGTIVDRFLKNTALPLIWKNYPEQSPAERAFCNFHLHGLWKTTKDSEDLLKVKIFFKLCMDLVEKTIEYSHYDDKCAGEGAGEGAVGSACVSEKAKKTLSGMMLDEKLMSLLKEDVKNFESYFLKTFLLGTCLRKIGIRRDNMESMLEATIKSEMQNSIDSELSQSSDSRLQYSFRRSKRALTNRTDVSNEEKALGNFYSVLNCVQISDLKERKSQNNLEVTNFIQDFKFYEKLEPNLMIQRLLEAQEGFNAIESSYFAPTDSLIMVLHNDFDERGIFCGSASGVILTPVGLRDFYRYVYPEIGNWLIEEETENAKFMLEITEKAREKEEKRDAAFLAQLRRKYCQLSEDGRKEFLKADFGEFVPEVKEKELGEFSVKPKPSCSNKVSFVATNLTDVRVENGEKICEFYSQDGTQVTATIEGWLYTPLELLNLRVKRSNFSLYYNQWLEKDPNTNFTLKTNSGIILSFYKTIELNFSATISWPTGLLIRPVVLDSVFYIRQSYLKPYRRGWEIEKEKSRCFVRNGQLLIFKNNGDYEILCGSGTKYTFFESAPTPRCEIISTTGEVWQFQTSCVKRKTLTAVNRIFLGVDPTTKETFYKREDGTYCMLWGNGMLVTNYPDGTKITTTPYFEEAEVTTEWTDEEKLYFEELEPKQKGRSKTILRNSSTPRATESRVFNVSGFVVVSCEYLTEHPKYASVRFNPNDPFVRLALPEQLTVFVHPEGIYKVQQDMNFLSVENDMVEFYKVCPECNEKSTVKLYVDSSDIVCRCVDFSQRAFFVYRNGNMNFQECYEDFETEEMPEYEKQQRKSSYPFEKCASIHEKSQSLMQRCFALERDLSGVEFIHTNCLSFHFYQLPENTYFDIHTNDHTHVCHTSSSPYYKIGCEKWLMDYEDKNNSLPTNLKKRDMKEIGVKQVTRNNFKYPFPRHHNSANQQQNEKAKRNVNEPKVIVSRTLWCLSQDPKTLIDELRKCAMTYQGKAAEIFNEYKNHKVAHDRSCDSRYVEMRLRKIALTLSQSLHMYPHLCNNLPSTEKDIHYFGHFLNSMENVKIPLRNDEDLLPICKQIPNRLPRSSEFDCIYEESESPKNT